MRLDITVLIDSTQCSKKIFLTGGGASAPLAPCWLCPWLGTSLELSSRGTDYEWPGAFSYASHYLKIISCICICNAQLTGNSFNWINFSNYLLRLSHAVALVVRLLNTCSYNSETRLLSPKPRSDSESTISIT